MSNYARKSDLRTATDVDTSQFTKKDDLSNLKSEINKLDIDELEKVPSSSNNLKSKIDRLDIDKLKATPINLSKPSNLVIKQVIKKTKYDDLFKKVHNTDICKLVIKTNYNAKNKTIEDKIPDITKLATNDPLNAKTNEVKT